MDKGFKFMTAGEYMAMKEGYVSIDIQRWDEYEYGHGMVPCEDGFYVRYDDHVKAVRELEKRINELLDSL